MSELSGLHGLIAERVAAIEKAENQVDPVGWDKMFQQFMTQEWWSVRQGLRLLCKLNPDWEGPFTFDPFGGHQEDQFFKSIVDSNDEMLSMMLGDYFENVVMATDRKYYSIRNNFDHDVRRGIFPETVFEQSEYTVSGNADVIRSLEDQVFRSKVKRVEFLDWAKSELPDKLKPPFLVDIAKKRRPKVAERHGSRREANLQAMLYVLANPLLHLSGDKELGFQLDSKLYRKNGDVNISQLYKRMQQQHAFFTEHEVLNEAAATSLYRETMKIGNTNS